jgi:hypothetical protein
MKRTTRWAVAFAGCAAVAVISLGSGILKGQDNPQYVSSTYLAGAQEVTIKTLDGQVLSVLHVPTGVELSIHVVRGSKGAKPGVFAGDLSIRVLPKSRLQEGALLPQMMQAPFELYLQNVDVSLK